MKGLKLFFLFTIFAGGFSLVTLCTVPLKAQNLDSLFSVWQDSAQPDTSRLKALYVYTWRGFLFSNPDSAAVLAEMQYDFAESRGLEKDLINALNTLGVSSNIRGEFKEAIEYYQQCLEIAEEFNFKSGISSALGNIGNSYYSLGDFVKAIEYHNRCLRIKEELGDPADVAKTLNNIGVIFGIQGDYANSIVYHTRSLKVREEAGDSSEMANSLHNIGTIYGIQEEHDRAIEYYDRCLEIREKTRDTTAMATTLGNLGNEFLKSGNYEKALDFHTRGLEIKKSVGDKSGIASSLSSIGSIYSEQEEYEKALDYFNESLVVREEIEDKHGIASALNKIGRLYYNKGAFNEAQKYGTEALEAAQEVGAIVIIENSAKLLWDVYKETNNYRGALKMHELYISSRDSIKSEENQKEIMHQRFQYDYDKKESLLQAEQEKKDALAAEQLHRKNLQRNAFIGGFSLMLLLALTFLLQRKRISKEKARSEELLLNILPEEVAEELKAKGEAEAQLIEHVTVLFTDFKGFTALSERVTPKELVHDLHECFSAFDRICERYGIEKIKTIGDAYMAAGGLPSPNTTHAQDVVKAALKMAEVVNNGKAKKMATGLPYFEVRIGIHTGPVVAGIVGVKKFQYDIWGDTVNTASRMESSGEVGKVNISEATYNMVKDDFNCEYRGEIEAKGKGKVKMFFLLVKSEKTNSEK